MANKYQSNIEEVPLLPWEDFLTGMQMDGSGRTWKQGEHVALIGKTGCGKTTLANAILPIRKYVTVVATKPKSPSLEKFMAENDYKRYKTWPKPGKDNPALSPRRVLWPPAPTLSAVGSQRQVIWDMMNDMYGTGGWCLYVDELRFITETMNLGKHIELFLMQGRELNISVVAGMQRPKFVPLTMYSQSRHLFFWAEKDVNNLERIGAINSIDSRFLAGVVTELPPHQFLYINSDTGYLCRSMAPDPNSRG